MDEVLTRIVTLANGAMCAERDTAHDSTGLTACSECLGEQCLDGVYYCTRRPCGAPRFDAHRGLWMYGNQLCSDANGGHCEMFSARDKGKLKTRDDDGVWQACVPVEFPGDDAEPVLDTTQPGVAFMACRVCGKSLICVDGVWRCTCGYYCVIEW